MVLKRTPLYDTHVSLGARMVPFAGWEMPVQYSGVKEEHLAVRSSCGLFDVSHMGEIEVSGDRAIDLVQLLITNDIERVSDGQCQYALLCRDNGGAVDDLIVYRFNIDRYLFVVNASNAGKVLGWMKEVQAREDFSDVGIEDQGGQYAQLALQGPAAVEILKPLLDTDPAGIGHFRFHMGLIGDDVEAIVSRTGYTGADGFEIYLAPEDAEAAWKALMEAGSTHGLRPAGLGARDTLRLEMGYPLYGHELGEDITPIEAGLAKYVRFTKDFIGRDVLERQAREGTGRTLVGIRMLEPGVPRQGYEIHTGGKKVGEVTSGTVSPSLNIGIAMGFVSPESSKPGTEVSIVIRGRAAKAEITTLPFYKK
ncbi:MAG: glycine cleavage system aminomethyltransferase GcvT [Candidatus Methylomirabilis sp.]|nr:glycine cleavage system aminomethyltransferase GcvT [Deltaproteobacteria bacterium]